MLLTLSWLPGYISWILSTYLLLISSTIWYTRGSNLENNSIGHFSRASAMIVWFVYAHVLHVISHASSHSRPSTSISILISSATATVGCVSFIWNVTLSGSLWISLLVSLNLRIALCTDAEMKKYCCLSLSSLPA